MRSSTLILSALLLTFTAMLGCDAEPEDFDDVDERGLILDIRPPTRAIPVGAKWGPCDLTGVNQPGWWGCDGAPGVGQACARPVSDLNLHICVPQTADPVVDADCGNVTAPFGIGVSTIGNGSAYCGVDCVSNADCAGGMACSPASHICAYIGG
jgi:hypothetical protein